MASDEPCNTFDLHVDTLIIGAGACGLVAALAACEAGQEVLVIEADAVPAGSTALSAGLIPAAGTVLQRQAGITDSPELFARDIQRKAHGENDPELVDALTCGAAKVMDWLVDQHELPFTLVDDFDYPGHSQRRMHGLPSRSGTELINALRTCCEKAGIDIVCHRRATDIFQYKGCVTGVRVGTDDHTTETIGCKKLILACNGFGGNRDMVKMHMPQIADALWFGHDGNRGEAVKWGGELGAAVAQLGAYQGHGNVAHPHGILITWAVITQGGIQVNNDGERFWDESQGYSEAARRVLSQAGGSAITLFDQRIAGIARQFEDFKQAEKMGAVLYFETLETLAEHYDLPVATLIDTVASLPFDSIDRFGREFSGTPLVPPYFAVRVTGALFHTQGGLRVTGVGQVMRQDGKPVHNMFAGGGAACGVSGSNDTGYLSGNGLLSAVVLGYYAGQSQPEDLAHVQH